MEAFPSGWGLKYPAKQRLLREAGQKGLCVSDLVPITGSLGAPFNQEVTVWTKATKETKPAEESPITIQEDKKKTTPI